MSKKGKLLIIGAISILSIIIFLILSVGNAKESKQTKIGFIMSGGIEDTGWNGNHYNGIKEACEKLDAELLVKEEIKEFAGTCEGAICELAEEGAEMIFLSSYGYNEEVHEIVTEYPEIVFYGNCPEFQEKNLTHYFTRMYQARYLSGIIAGMMTKTNQIGYVAAMSNHEVNRGISAFTLGVRRVNPNAKVLVTWTGDWDNKEQETIATNKDKGVVLK